VHYVQAPCEDKHGLKIYNNCTTEIPYGPDTATRLLTTHVITQVSSVSDVRICRTVDLGECGPGKRCLRPLSKKKLVQLKTLQAWATRHDGEQRRGPHWLCKFEHTYIYLPIYIYILGDALRNDMLQDQKKKSSQKEAELVKRSLAQPPLLWRQ